MVRSQVGHPQSPLFQTALEAVVWGMPIVSFDSMRQAFLRDAHARYNDIVYWSRPVDWHTRFSTPDALARHVYASFSTVEGPVVVEIPRADGGGLFGSILDAWQVPMTELGSVGADEGAGARYLLLPPEHTSEYPPGFIPVHMDTFNGLAAIRAIPDSGSEQDVQRVLELVRGIRVYPLAALTRPPDQRFIDMAGKPFNGIVRFDSTFFTSLTAMLNEEPIASRDRAVMQRLQLLDLRKGSAFSPGRDLRQVLIKAARAAHAHFMKIATVDGVELWGGRHWRVPGSMGAKTHFTFERDGTLNIESRGLFYFLACAPPTQSCVTTWVDKSGASLAGGHDYHLHIPASVPVWAVTVYDATTAAFVHQAQRVEVSSRDHDLQRNDDGSVDVHFCSTHRNLANSITTPVGKQWFACVRFYGLVDSLFQQAWQLPDIERLRAARATVA